MSVVITGSSGFVARNLRHYLHTKNIPVVAISRKNFPSFKNEKKIITKNYGDSLLGNIKHCSALVHLAGIGKQDLVSDYQSVNVELTKKIIDLCKAIKLKLVFTSGLGVSSHTTVDYFVSKFKAEQAVLKSGLDYTIFRPSYIIGKDDLLTKSLSKQIAKTGQILVPGSGQYCIQPIHVGDVSEIIYQAITQKRFSRKIIDLVGPDVISFEKYVRMFASSRKAGIKKIPLEEAYYKAINGKNFPYSVDDLNLLIGNFRGNCKLLKRISKIKFQHVGKLQSSGLS